MSGSSAKRHRENIITLAFLDARPEILVYCKLNGLRLRFANRALRSFKHSRPHWMAKEARVPAWVKNGEPLQEPRGMSRALRKTLEQLNQYRESLSDQQESNATSAGDNRPL